MPRLRRLGDAPREDAAGSLCCCWWWCRWWCRCWCSDGGGGGGGRIGCPSGSGCCPVPGCSAAAERLLAARRGMYGTAAVAPSGVSLPGVAPNTRTGSYSAAGPASATWRLIAAQHAQREGGRSHIQSKHTCADSMANMHWSGLHWCRRCLAAPADVAGPALLDAWLAGAGGQAHRQTGLSGGRRGPGIAG